MLDARYCISCHTEHQHEQTIAMGLTIPDDYCYHCHVDIGEERESHKDLAFDSCGSAGCHNFHDNRALYEAFLVENSGQPWLGEIARIAAPNHAALTAQPDVAEFEIAFAEKANLHPDITAEWSATGHAKAGVSCAGCHSEAGKQSATDALWIDKPGLSQCQSCHAKEAEGFSSGKHGMRLSDKLAAPNAMQAISPAEAHLEFSDESMNFTHGCNSCHEAHSFDIKTAAVESCLGCHADEHSLAYLESPHAQLWEKELSEPSLELNEGVSCATCHMPRIESKQGKSTLVHVEHNQNMNLRPNEKMIRPVCMQCHSLEFSIDALADPELIKNNFNGQPSVHIESVEWALKRGKR